MLSTIRNFLRSLDRSPLAWPIAIAGALIFALMLPVAMGLTYGDHTLREFWDWKNILFVILTLFTLSQWKISRWFIAIPLVLIFGCYLPAGILYGKPSILVAIALMQTTPAETQEFLMNTPWQLFAEAIGFIFAGGIAWLAKQLCLDSISGINRQAVDVFGYTAEIILLFLGVLLFTGPAM